MSTFTEKERQNMEHKLDFAPGTLKHGKWPSSPPVTEYLNNLSTWFRSKEEASIAQRIHQKIDELGHTYPVSGPGYYKGRHYTTYVWDYEQLKKEGRLEEEEILLLGLVEAIEKAASLPDQIVPPAYYEDLAIIYRKRKEYIKEVHILQRYIAFRPKDGPKAPRLIERLKKAKLLSQSVQDRK